MTQLDPDARAFLDMMAASGHPPMEQLPVSDARAAYASLMTQLEGPKADVAEVRDLMAGAIPLRVYRPAGSRAGTLLPGLVYFHGGGFVSGSIAAYDNLCRRLSNASGCAVISVDYRLAPEHKFPAPVDDAYAATCWVAANAKSLGVDAARLGTGGDSAGGTLSALVSLRARDQNGPALRHQLLIYPATDLQALTESHRRRAEGYFLTAALIAYVFGSYVRSATDRSDPRASPLLAQSHAKLPPAHVLVCGFDPLMDEGLAYAEKLRRAGVPVTLRQMDDQIHGFLGLPAAIPAANRAMDEVGAVLRKAL